jgi:hypothetical protein
MAAVLCLRWVAQVFRLGQLSVGLPCFSYFQFEVL